jgi:eukaryotic-like serine/threonine-protein kinase
MTPARWGQVKDALAAFLELEASARPDRLAKLRLEDPGLADEVRDLADWDERAGVALEARPSFRPVLTKGSELFGFEILGSIGGGGMAEIYEAGDLSTGARVALKVFSGAAWNAARRRRFEREARAIGALNHPNVLRMISFHADDVGGAVATELLEGEDLRHRMNRLPLGLEEARAIARQVARGLSEAHGMGIVHRDLKPENVFLGSDGGVKLLDFGLAKIVGERRLRIEADRSATSQPGELMGTAAYMSPEQVRTEGVTPASDVFAFGSLLHEMISGRPPFLRDTPIDTMFAVVNEPPEPLPAGDAGLSSIVAGCLEKDPSRRHVSGRALIELLEALDNLEPGGPPRAL